MNKSADFSHGNVFSMILRFSIPAAVSLLITAIYNIVDRMFIGNFCGSTELAALSVCFPLPFMMTAFGLMCSAGGSTLFTLFRGRDENKKANTAFGSAFLLTILFELLLTAALLLFADGFLKIFGVTATTYDFALAYYKIVSIGCLFQGLTFVFCDFVRVSGKPMLGMCVTGIGAVTNIVLDAIFVAAFHWGVAGAAWATVIGQVISTIFGLYLILSKRTLVEVTKATFRIDKKISFNLLSCGFAFWIAQMAMGFIALVYNGRLGKYGGDTAISVYAVISSIMTFIIMPASGISQGIQPLLGYNYSKSDGRRVREIFIKASIFSVGVTVIIWAVTELFPETIINLFGGGAQMLETGVPALRSNFIFAPVLGFVMLATTFFQSIGKPKASSVITAVRQIIILVPAIYVLPMVLGLSGIFWAQPVSDLLATILSVLLIIREFRLLDQAGGTTAQEVGK